MISQSQIFEALSSLNTTDKRKKRDIGYAVVCKVNGVVFVYLDLF